MRTCMREVRAPESRYGGRENEAEEGAEQMGEERRRKRKRKLQKGGYFEKPPSFCIMSVNQMFFLGGRGRKKLTLHTKDGAWVSPSARCSDRFIAENETERRLKNTSYPFFPLSVARQVNIISWSEWPDNSNCVIVCISGCSACVLKCAYTLRSYERTMPE